MSDTTPLKPETSGPAAPPAAAPTTDVTLKIDGKSVTVPKGTNVLEAAKVAGIEISYFCYHPGLSSPAVCRQCLVGVKGQPKLVPSCYTPVAPDMEVTTDSDQVLTARQQMLEFTLVNHPVDCPICDKSGECSLQKQFDDWDGGASRTDVPKREKPKHVDLGPTIVLDAERCILCTRCIRVCDEIAHSHQLTMSIRGDRQQISTAPGQTLDNPYSLNTVDVCPVGALTAKDFRFTMRAWELEKVDSVCPGCATGCNTEVHFSKGRIYRLIPRENLAVNKYWMCDEGRFTYHAVRKDRHAIATLRGEPAAVDKALAAASDRLAAVLQSAGPGVVGVVLNAQATNEDNYALAKLATALGIERFYLAGRAPRPERQDDILMHADVNPNTTGARAIVEALAPGKAKGGAQLGSDILSGSIKAIIALDDTLELDDDTRAAYGRLDLLVTLTSYTTGLTEHSHVALPIPLWAEVDGTFTNVKGLVQRVRKALEPAGDSRPAWEMLRELGKRLNAALPFPTVKMLFKDMTATVPAFTGAQFGRDSLPVLLRFAGSRG
ncbi:MAG: 2Fe-2S iron-sulfur cluster-binding protein [Polyangia bacterium]